MGLRMCWVKKISEAFSDSTTARRRSRRSFWRDS
jgi:hypothetical protein